MARLPTDLSGRRVRAALERAGFVFVRQKGSTTVPSSQAPSEGSIADAGVTVDEFAGLLK